MDLLTLHLHSYKRVICITIVTKTLQEYIYMEWLSNLTIISQF